MPHVHLSLQAMDDMVLKRMLRRHNRALVLDIISRLRTARPNIALGADIIAGFPTEDEQMAENTIAGTLELGLDYFHVFPYSPRPGTPAEKMPQVDVSVIKQRAKNLRNMGDRQLQLRLKSMVGKTISVLVEKPATGRSECFALVDLDTEQTPGEIVDVHVSDVTHERLLGRVV